MDDEQERRFTAMFSWFAPRVFGYVRRRCDAAMAEDVVADTFLTAWRLRENIPDEPLPWLLVIARNALGNRQRSLRRADRLQAALAGIEQLAAQKPAVEEVIVDRSVVLHAVGSLSRDEREAVLLVAWDGLSQRDAARVADCSPGTLSRRLARARRRLSRALNAHLDHAIEPSGVRPLEESS